jgi:spindle assembly abnormal protein 6
MKLKNVVTLQQEKLLDERATTLETKQEEIKSMRESLDKALEEKRILSEKVESLTTKIEESKQLIEDNQNGPCSNITNASIAHTSR